MSFPNWADEQLSKDLPILRSKGENQDLEYMESFPTNARELGKEIAAFASSNQGTILIGVADNGDLIGLDTAKTLEARDELIQRVEGICKGTIKPSITPIARFACENSLPVLVIIVPKGSQPIYYNHHTPYIRHITESRPAEPHEVIELFKQWVLTAKLEEEKIDPLSELISELAPIIIDVLIYGNEAEKRNINPWLDMWRAQFRQTASELRNLAIKDVAIKNELSDKLEGLAQVLDKISNMRLAFGFGPKLYELVSQAVGSAKKIKHQIYDSITLSQEPLKHISENIKLSSKQLNNLMGRADDMAEQGRLDQFQAEASAIGYKLLKISHYKIDDLKKGLSQDLQTIGKELHLVETLRTYLDGGKSVLAIIKRVSEQNSKLIKITGYLELKSPVLHTGPSPNTSS